MPSFAIQPDSGFPGGSDGKGAPCNAGDLGSIPGWGRSPGEGKDYPLQYSGLENPRDYTVHGVAKSWTLLSNFHFHNLEPVHCSMSGSNCCFLTCIQASQEAGKVVWYSHLLKNFPQFVVIQITKWLLSITLYLMALTASKINNRKYTKR